MKLKHKIALFAAYFILFSTILSVIDYYAYATLNPWTLLAISIVGALFAMVVHVKNHAKSKVDEIAHDIEEIL